MIDDKKLISAFIYSAYDSGYCGINLGLSEKQRHMELYKNHIKDGSYFPQKEINETQKKMMDLVEASNVRDYIYGGHFDVVKRRISEETGKDFCSAIKSPMTLLPAISCPIAFYEVIESGSKRIVGRNLFLGKLEKELSVLEGLENPKVGDIVSGHWNHFLEIVGDWKDLDKYKKISEDYINFLKDSRRE
ncbi:MAG: hypothetical protein OEL87_01665 [Nanoarchaeota archaeon]|nr:hypothetical protein [Nanoarchaeota archaeon]